jgi:hypothetical protein
VQSASLHESVGAEDLGDGSPERLGAVEHGQDAVLEPQPAGHQISEQVGDHDGVLGVTETQTDRHLRAVSGDDQGDDDHLAGDVEPIDHQHRRLQRGQVRAQHLIHRLGGRGDETA